jgi:hypothetical protein
MAYLGLLAIDLKFLGVAARRRRDRNTRELVLVLSNI